MFYVGFFFKELKFYEVRKLGESWKVRGLQCISVRTFSLGRQDLSFWRIIDLRSFLLIGVGVLNVDVYRLVECWSSECFSIDNPWQLVANS